MTKRKRGRPPFKVTPTVRDEVELLTAVGMPQEDIARAIGCAVDTLVKHFADELAHGRARKRKQIVAMLQKSAKRGNVTAQRTLENMTRVAGAEVEFEQAIAAPKAEPLGKKAAAAEAARTVGGAGTEWGDDLHPSKPLN